MSATLPERLAAVRERVDAACARAGRSSDDVTLVGVSKRKPVADVVAAVEAGLDHLGENYAQEAVPKVEAVNAALRERGVAAPHWHFVGQLQRNKAGKVAAAFDCIETVDRESLARTLDARAEAAGRSIDVLVQVNVSGEAQKGGVEPGALGGLLAACAPLEHLRVAGLMAVPERAGQAEASRPAFARLRALAETHRGELGACELSMGMSGDFEVAIEEGASWVRVGTAIFGPREG